MCRVRLCRDFLQLTGEIALDKVPVNEIPERLQILRTRVTIVDVVGMFPDVACHQRRQIVGHWVARVTGIEVMLNEWDKKISDPKERLHHYIDMQLHQTQLVEVVALDGLWRRGAVIPLGDCGLLALLNSAAHFLADRFIDQHRFDPLKLASSAQSLYTLIATSLLDREGDFTVELESTEGRLNCTIDANSWQQMLCRRLDSLLQSVHREFARDTLCLHGNSQWLQRLFDMMNRMFL